jgi:hypothetical protein
MNRRSFLKSAIKVSAFIPLLPSLVPIVEAAKEKEQEQLGVEGGYIIPTIYHDEMEKILRGASPVSVRLR